MGIQNFPAALQPIIQTNMLEREFQQALRSRLGYRAVADREDIAVGIGETLTKTRAGLKPTVTTPLVPSANTNLDNGLTPGSWGVEQYTLGINMYGATMDLNTVTSRVGIAGQFLQNAYANGEQAMRSLDDLARNALFNVYMGGNTRVRTTLGSPGTTVAVDDVRGFQNVFVAGVQTPTSNTNFIAVQIGSTVYNIGAVAVDGSNVSTLAATGGISGTLTTVSGNITVADGTAGNAVVASTAPSVIRPNNRTNTSTLIGTDVLTMANLLDAKTKLELNNVPTVGGFYNCYLDPASARQLFADSDFKQLFQGATAEQAQFRAGNSVESPFLGLRFLRTTEAIVQTLGSVTVRRPIICGQGALIEGDFAGMAAPDVAPDNAIVSIVDGIAMVTREPLDRLQQIIAQSWYWIGGFTCPSDTTTNSTTIPTATNANFKRAVMIEHAG
jgi:hypothetical protein